MKRKAQSLIEFAVILLIVTTVAVISLQIINAKINSTSKNDTPTEEQTTNNSQISQEEANCIENGLSWDKQNGVCEAK